MACFAKLKQNYKVCVICGNEFPDSISNPTVTCSPYCSKENRKRLHQKGIYEKSLEAAHEAFSQHPLTGPFETHMHAKEWVIQSPDGKVFRCRNLKLWVREHESMLDGTVKQAWDGLVKIKYSAQGKRKRKTTQWKGWRLLEWGD